MSWTRVSRFYIFCLGASSIAGLLLQFYGIITLRVFTMAGTLPAAVILIWMYLRDGQDGEHSLQNAIVLGAVSGFAACIAYDLFRLPFVLMHASGSNASLALPLFKVFPRFGALLLAQPIEQPAYSIAAYVIGWAYHFSNGLGFGIMYVAAIGNPARRSWVWAVGMAVGLEVAMLLTPYAGTFSIHVGSAFLFLTLSAHVVFGVALGLCARWLAWTQ